MGGPSPGSRNWNQAQGGFGGPGMTPQGYGNVQMPASTGGYGRGEQNPSGGWGLKAPAAFHPTLQAITTGPSRVDPWLSLSRDL